MHLYQLRVAATGEKRLIYRFDFSNGGIRTLQLFVPSKKKYKFTNITMGIRQMNKFPINNDNMESKMDILNITKGNYFNLLSLLRSHDVGLKKELCYKENIHQVTVNNVHLLPSSKHWLRNMNGHHTHKGKSPFPKENALAKETLQHQPLAMRQLHSPGSSSSLWTAL